MEEIRTGLTLKIKLKFVKLYLVSTSLPYLAAVTFSQKKNDQHFVITSNLKNLY